MSDLSIQFQIECKQTKPGDSVYVVGSSKELGNWKSEKSQKLTTDKDRFPIWESNPISFNSKSQLEYKYIIKNNSNNVKWEDFSGNRTLDLSTLENTLNYIYDGKFSNKSNQRISKTNDISSFQPKNYEKKKSNKKKSNNNNNNNHNSNNYQYTNTNADEYVKSRREDIKNVDINQLDFKGNGKKINKDIEDFINLLF